MSQAQPNPAPRRRHSRGRLKPVEKQERQGRRSAAAARQATVTPMEPRRRTKTAKGGLPRLPLFLAGIGLGYGLNGPIPHLATGLLAGLHHSSNVIGSLVAPAGMGDRRIVVMGTDHVSTNTDVMFTVQLRDGRTELTQVPRDTFIDSSRYGVMKANSLYSSGGPEMVKQELSQLLSAKVDRYLVLNLNAVQRLAEAIGGVEVDVPKRMHYVDNSQGLYIDLYPGRQLLQGKELEGFLRFRHDELGDIGRMERQKLVLAQVFRKLAHPATATRLPDLLRIAGSDIRTDLSPVDLGALMTAMATTKLSTRQLAGTPYWYEDISYWMPDGSPSRTAYPSSQPPL
ncbi:MAG: LCP family protein [Vulcanococcus sp.]